MKDDLADRLLAEVLKWDEVASSNARAQLQALARLKYDGYQQFLPGMRFVERFAIWLNQFDEANRKAAYDFVRRRLIYISQVEMHHLVKSVYPDIIRPCLINSVANAQKMSKYHVCKIWKSPEFRIALDESLFLGLSDGAHMDWFRRSNYDINNEQVYNNYEISIEKVSRLKSELRTRLSKRLGRTLDEDVDVKFKNLFIMDDFSGSGKTMLRRKNGEFKGKLARLNNLLFEGGSLSGILDSDKCRIYLIIYVATSQAIQNIQETVKTLGKIWDENFEIIVLLKIPDDIKVTSTKDREFYPLIHSYYDKKIENQHSDVGGSGLRFGFSNCSLPLILFHNTPNNSIYLLFAPQNFKVFGLFPRIQRHMVLGGNTD